MIYLDHGATSFPKPLQVRRAVCRAMAQCANPGRGGHEASMAAARAVLSCRIRAGKLFGCPPEQVVFTCNCTHGLNIALKSLWKRGDRVVISGFEHNAVVRPLHAMGVEVVVAGRHLFDPENTLEEFEMALKRGVQGAVFTHCSNVFGYILPVHELAALCHRYQIPFVVDAAQSAGHLPVSLEILGADFIAMPGHKGLQGPMGTGLLLCKTMPKPLLQGGTGSVSEQVEMPDFLPDAAEAGTLNVPGIAGLDAGLQWLENGGAEKRFTREQKAVAALAEGLESLGYRVYTGKDQGAVLSFTGHKDCEQIARHLAQRQIAVRAGLHCAPLAHRSAGTLHTGTVRLSPGHTITNAQIQAFFNALGKNRM